MKKYLVKETYTATADNTTFAGEVHTYYRGKRDNVVGSYGNIESKYHSPRAAWVSDIKYDGYDRRCDAARNWSYKHPENTKFWTTSVEIVEVETDDLPKDEALPIGFETIKPKNLLDDFVPVTRSEKVIKKVGETFGDNAKYVLPEIADDLRHLANAENRPVGHPYHLNDTELDHLAEIVLERAQRAHDRKLTPVTAKVGDGATLHFYTDADAYTIIKVTKATIVLQRDKATLSPDFKPNFIVGGFAGHCTNQNEQTYTYERDPHGSTITAYWSKKYNQYQYYGQKVTRGRHEFYDYNF